MVLNTHIIVIFLDFKIKLNNVGIKISQQRGHSNFEEYCFIPIEAFRIVNKEV